VSAAAVMMVPDMAQAGGGAIVSYTLPIAPMLIGPLAAGADGAAGGLPWRSGRLGRSPPAAAAADPAATAAAAAAGGLVFAARRPLRRATGAAGSGMRSAAAAASFLSDLRVL
jgi:hypothetical protein